MKKKCQQIVPRAEHLAFFIYIFLGWDRSRHNENPAKEHGESSKKIDPPHMPYESEKSKK